MVSSIWTRRGSITAVLRHAVRALGGRQARDTAEQVAKEKQKPRDEE